MAAAAGAVSGYAALGFIVLIGAVQGLLVGFDDGLVVSHISVAPPWRVVLAPALGGLAVGLFVRYLVPGRRAYGPADVVEAVQNRDGEMSLRTGLGSAAASVVSIGSGASVGRYGPAVHLGATLGATLARLVRFEGADRRAVLAGGVAAAIAAAFNAPLAGVLFAHEVVIGGFALRAMMPIVVASAVGASVARAHGSAVPIFELPDQGIAFAYEYPLFLLVGLAGAGLALAYMRALDLSARHVPRLRLPAPLAPMAGGVLIGGLALGFPQIFGLGEEAIQDALAGRYALGLLLALVVVKMLATSLSLGFGFAGGVLGPALFLGTMMGMAIGQGLGLVLPGLVSPATVYGVAGMGAVASRVVGAPIATILIVFELTSSHTLTAGAMIAVVVASIVGSARFPGSYFHFQLAERGLDPFRRREVALLGARTVREIVRPSRARVAPSAAIDDALACALAHPGQDLYVVGEGERLAGRLTLFRVVEASRAGRGAEPVTALLDGEVVALEAGTDLHTAMRTLRDLTGRQTVPVVERRATMRLLGVVHEDQLNAAFDAAVRAARAEERG